MSVHPKPWRCELCGHTTGLIENRGHPHRIECFSVPACEARRRTALADLDGCPTCHGITEHVIGCPQMDEPR